MNQPTGISASVRIQCSASPRFGEWLSRAGGSLVMSTYQAGKVAMVGWDGRQVTLLMRDFDKPLGLAVEGNRLVLATRHELWMFANAPLLAHEFRADQPGRYDALYLPRATYHTGDLNTHDVAFAGDELVLVNTRFSCLARLGHEFSFAPVWRPKFVSDVVPEDRCHLNGLVVQDGEPKYVTALGRTDTAGGWRERKADGGVLLDVETGEVILGGLSMPHSPRWHDGRLWLLNSGTGELVTVDPARGQRTTVCRLPGYLRGLGFVGQYALVGLSKIREKHIFGGLPVQQRYDGLRCGVAVIDLETGSEVGMFEYTEGCEELYDVDFLPGVLRPMILNLNNPAVRQAFTNPESSFWLRPGAEVVEEFGAPDQASERPTPRWSSGPQMAGLEPTGNFFPESRNPNVRE